MAIVSIAVAAILIGGNCHDCRSISDDACLANDFRTLIGALAFDVVWNFVMCCGVDEAMDYVKAIDWAVPHLGHIDPSAGGAVYQILRFVPRS